VEDVVDKVRLCHHWQDEQDSSDCLYIRKSLPIVGGRFFEYR
jgi:hypothetical protein